MRTVLSFIPVHKVKIAYSVFQEGSTTRPTELPVQDNAASVIRLMDLDVAVTLRYLKR